MILRPDLTLSNTNMPKKSTFAWFFSLNSLCRQWLFVSSQRQSSPSLLTMLKSCEAFFVYTHLNMANLIPFTKRFESSENLVNLLNHEVYWFVIETKPYSTLTILVITDCLLICILCWRCPKQHICIRKVQHSKRWWCFIALTRNWDYSCSMK